MKNILLSFLIIGGVSANAQIKDTVKLMETVISASRWEQEVKSVPSQVIGITAKTNAFQNQQTTADMLQNTGQIFVQKSQTGGGSTVLRGFESSRVSLVVDGVRLNNAIYRMGHLQDVITIDQSMLSKTEILFGPSSTMYGSDALGGVMHFYTKNPQLDKFGVGAYVRFSTANSEKTGHVDFNLGYGKFASLTSITYSDFGDVRVGNTFDSKYGDWGKCTKYVTRDYSTNKDVINNNANPNVMVGSAYKQYDLLQKFLFKQSETVTHELNVQLSNNVGNVPRYDRLLLLKGNGKPKFAENYYGPQTRLFAAYTLDLSAKTSFYDDAKLILSTQKINQDRISRSLDDLNRTSNLEDANIYAANFDLTKKLSDKANLYYGAEYIYNGITSTASLTDVVTGKVTWNKDNNAITTRFADGGSTWSSLAAYAQMNYKLNEILSATGGVRLSSVSLTSNYNNATLYPVNKVTSASIAPSGTLGLVANLPSETKVSVLGSTGFRAPNVEDMTAFSPAGGTTARVPNSALKPEYAYNGEFNIVQRIGSAFKLETGAYYTVLTNAMVVRDTKYNGSDFVTINGIVYKAQSIQNANHGNIYGWYVAEKLNITNEITVNASLNATYGNYTLTQGAANGVSDSIVPMDHIPPMFGKVGITYTGKKIQAELFTRFSVAKKLQDYSPSGEDNLEQAAYTADPVTGKYTVAAGTPAWTTLNIRAGYEFTKNISLNTGIENILDTHYRQFASGISAPGRNIYGTLRVNF